jgi:hypothetical protein
MPRTYNARITALITGVQAKWLDNLLSRHNLPGVARDRQGIERRISDEGILAVELCRILNLELGVSLAQAAQIATLCLRTATEEMSYTTPSGMTLSLPVGATRARLRERTMEAVEMVGATPRGRPPGRRT